MKNILSTLLYNQLVTAIAAIISFLLILLSSLLSYLTVGSLLVQFSSKAAQTGSGDLLFVGILLMPIVIPLTLGLRKTFAKGIANAQTKAQRLTWSIIGKLQVILVVVGIVIGVYSAFFA